MAAPKTIGRYTVERLLGSGSFATVWLAHDPGLDARIALKVLAENWSLDDDIRRRFLEEARILWRAQHDRIVRVHLVEALEDGRPYFVMDYADGGTLHDRLRDRFARGEQCSIGESVAMAREIAECLAVAHNLGIVHRDLKPSNILFQSVPGRRRGADANAAPEERVVLADFGLARRLESAAPRTVIAGTPAYMAPEQGDPERSGRADERSDLFSASAILYEMLAGRPPFPGQSIESVRDSRRWQEMRPVSELRPDVPSAIEAVVMKGLAYEPDDRYASVIEWSDALTAALARSGTAPANAPERAPDTPIARLNQAIGRLKASLGDSPVMGAVEQARLSLADAPGITVIGSPEAVATEFAQCLGQALATPVAAAVATIADDGTVELPESDADAVLLVLPPDPAAARPLVAAAQRAVQARADSPFLVLGIVPGAAGSDVALGHRSDVEISATVLTAFTVTWPLSTPSAQSRPVGDLLAQAYGAPATSCPALSTEELARVVEHLVLNRAGALQAETAVGFLRRGLVTHATDPAASDLADAVERLELALPELAELSVLRADVAGSLPLNSSMRSELRRVLLECDVLPRLGLTSEVHPSEASYAALEGAQRWREQADRLPYSVRDLAFAVARRYDSLWDHADRASGQT